ncbi:MAG: hypothetical protein ABIG42_07360 [bacterium]
MTDTTQIQRRRRRKTNLRDVQLELPAKPTKGGKGSIDYAQQCKELGKYDDGLDVLEPIIKRGELRAENWQAYALAGFFNLQRGETQVCQKLMRLSLYCLSADRKYFNCMKTERVYNHFAYHYDFQLLRDIYSHQVKRKLTPVCFQEITISTEGELYLTEGLGRKIIALDVLGNFLWGKSLNLARRARLNKISNENILMSSGYDEGVTLVDNATCEMIQMTRDGSFKTMAPLGSRFFRIHSFAQDYFGCIFVTEDNAMRLSIYEPDGKLQREIYLDEVMKYNSDVNPFTIIYDEEGYLHLYNIDLLLTLNGEGRQIFRKDIMTGKKSRNDWSKINKGVACDSSGRLYAVRPSENKVLVIDKGMGTELGELGPKLAGTKLKFPTDIAVDIEDNIYINDSGNARIVKINSRTSDVNTIFHMPCWKSIS